jgi:Putative peptidoglycan binding domain
VRRTLLIAGAAAVISGGAVAGLVATRDSGGKQAATDPALPPATAKVIRTTLVETKTVPGTLGYGDSVPIRAARSGTITWIAQVGSTVMRGEPLFKIDQRPLVDLYGSLPIYRRLREGMVGADVKQLERDLAALGSTGFSVDDTYDAATAAAVRAWQAKLGLPETGTVEPGQVVVTPGPIRIAAHIARLGDTTGRGSAEGGASVLSYTATTRRVAVGLEVADAALAVPGRTVRVNVPSRPAVMGKIASAGSVVTAQRTTADGGAA